MSLLDPCWNRLMSKVRWNGMGLQYGLNIFKFIYNFLILIGHAEEEEGLVIKSRDHLLIPKAGDATSLIKYHIYGMGENSTNR